MLILNEEVALCEACGLPDADAQADLDAAFCHGDCDAAARAVLELLDRLDWAIRTQDAEVEPHVDANRIELRRLIDARLAQRSGAIP